MRFSEKWLFYNEEKITWPREWGMRGKDYLTKRMRYENILRSGCAIMRKRLLDQENEVWDYLGKWLCLNEETITWPREWVWEEKITWPREWGMILSRKVVVPSWGNDYLTTRMSYERKRLFDQENEVWGYLGKWLGHNEKKIIWPREWGMTLSRMWLCHNEETITWPIEWGMRFSGEVVVL
jgi:hypothetical protein